ncbi:methyltransferase [Aphanothece sacrum FPU1]|uniref:Methyltransferase n=1 Tax=Aphanothece sacrum FPU1 TaxID=1920663 RepID=A0A401IF02_APHSA|nr:methyltransferase [Aphanothece sacrum FPU1]GBF86350.1 methyltransferase [Aphanothece sacrum FPU3]
MLLRPEQREKLDPSNDQDFYAFPRFVTHVDEGFIEQLTNLYRERLQKNTRILDLMSSWVSHLPDEVKFAHVEGHGMNQEELAKKPAPTTSDCERSDKMLDSILLICLSC